MANDVEFRISADTSPASKALKELKDTLSNMPKVRSVDKEVLKQQKELKKIQDGINEGLNDEKINLKNRLKLYSANEAQIKKNTAALEEQNAKTLKAEEVLATYRKDAAAALSAGDTNALAKEKELQDKVNEERTKAKEIEGSIAVLKQRNQRIDADAQKVLDTVLGKNKEVVVDEKTLLGYKVQERKDIQDATKSQQELEGSVKATNTALKKEALAAKNATDALTGTGKATNSGKKEELPISPQDLASLQKTAKSVLSKPMGPNKFTYADINTRIKELEEIKKKIEEAGAQKDLEDEYQQINVELVRMRKGYTALNKEAATFGHTAEQAVKPVVDEAAQAEKAIADLKEKITTTMSMPATTEAMGEGDYKARISDLTELQRAIEKLGLPPELRAQYDQLSEEIRRLNADYKALIASKQEMANSAPEQTLQDKMQDVANTVNRVGEAMRFDSAQNNIAELIRRLDALKRAKQAIEDAGMPAGMDSYYNAIIQMMNQTNNAITAYKRNLDGVNTEHKKAEQSGTSFGKRASAALSGLKSVAGGVGKLIHSIRSNFGGLEKYANKVKSSFDGMARNMRSNFKHMITRITKYVLGFRSLFFLVRRLRKYVGEGLQDLVHVNKGNNEVNKSISSLISYLEWLKRAWAAAFAPIITAVRPWLEGLLTTMAKVGNALARFIGVLTGQKTVYNALKMPMGNYAKSLDKAGKGAGKAAKKQKELNDRLADFDVLHVLGKDNDDDNDGGGSGSGDKTKTPDYDSMFKKVKAISKLADMIKKAWKTGDFTNVGEWFANKLITALDKINDPKNLAKALSTAEKFGKSVATFFNGLFAKPEIWEKMGQAIGNGLNVISRAISGFLKNNKVNWGEGLAKLINSIFKTVNWSEIKNNIKLFVDQIVKNLVAFMNNLDWEEIQKAAKAIGEGINSVISKTLQSPEFMQALGKTFGELVNTINAFISGVLNGGIDENGQLIGDDSKAVSIGEGIAQFFIKAFKTIKWKDVIKNIATVLSGLFDAINDLFSHEDELDEIAATLEEAFEEIDWTTVIVKAINAALKVGKFSTKWFALLSNALSDAIINADTAEVEQAVKTFIEGINVDDFTDSCEILGEALIKSLIASGSLSKIAKGIIGGIVSGFTSSITDNDETVEKISDVGKFLANKILFGAGGVFLDIMGWIRTNIVEPFYNGFMDVLNSDDVNPENLGSAIILGLQNGISNTFGTAIDWVRTWLVDPIIDGFKTLFKINSPSEVTEDWGKYLIDGLANGLNNNSSKISDAWNNIKTTITGIWSSTTFDVKAKLFDLKLKFVEIWNGIKNGIKAPIRGILSIVERMVNIVIDGINSMINKLDSMPSWDITNPFNGKKYKMGFNIPTLKHVTLPKLAQGAVIPPNREFMAVLGDQSSGTNIEAPLDTIKQAVAEVMANNNNAQVIRLLQELIAVVERKNLVIGDKEIGKANARYENKQRIIRGTSF